MNKILRLINIFSLLLMFVSSSLFAEGEKQNLVKNGGLETLITEETEGKDWEPWLKTHKRGGPMDWLWEAKLGPWSTLKGISLDKEVKWSGLYSLRLEATEFTSLSLQQYFPAGSIKQNTKYRLTYYIKTENVEIDPKSKAYCGACINMWVGFNRWFPYPLFKGTMKWTKQGFEFTTGQEELKTLYLQPGFWNATGIVWFDDICLEEVVEGNF